MPEYISEVQGRGGIEAKVVEYSHMDNYNQNTLITMQLKYPRFIHSEFMTHRMFSRNASSSRAIPAQKIIDNIRGNPAMPIHWGKNQKGMQANEENDATVNMPDDNGHFVNMSREQAWYKAMIYATRAAEAMNDAGYHKQVVNRLTEPFQFIHVLVTATEWNNFFRLRFHEDAQPEIYELARVMWQAKAKAASEIDSTQILAPGQWHLPYVTQNERIEYGISTLVKLSVARSARVSYKNHDNSYPQIDKDVDLYEMLYENGHWSPFEHQATPMDMSTTDSKWSGNFFGFMQYRKMAEQGMAL